MADNPSPSPSSGPQPPLPSSGTTGRLKSPTTQLPLKKGGPGKIVVMLSSVAKPAPAGTQALPQVTPPSDSPPKIIPSNSASPRQPPPLPPKQVTPLNTVPPPRLSATTHVKLPPKSSEPRWSSLSGAPLAAPTEKDSPVAKTVPPPLPAKRGAQLIPPIKLNQPSTADDASGESIFPSDSQPAPKPEGWKNLEKGELNPPSGGLQSLEIFARSQRILDKASGPEAKDAPLIAPPLRPPGRVETPPPQASIAAPPLQVAPPLTETAPDVSSEKLPPPHLPGEARKGEAGSSESSGIQKVPALIPTEGPTTPLPLPAPAKAKGGGNWLKKNWLKKTTPLVVSSATVKGPAPQAVEAKLALKPAVLPRRLATGSPEAGIESTPPSLPPEIKETGEKTEIATAPAALPAATETPSATIPDAPLTPPAPVTPNEKSPLPLTRVERAKKRRVMETVVFWTVIVPLTVLALFVVSLYFGRETRVEGQVIPPPGTSLNTEVWIVTDFTSLATGIAEDLAAERTPILQEIQERQDHVQRAQADVAAREERIRLIQAEMQATKDEILSLVKQSRDATQQIWDGEGAEIDSEYQSHLDQLKKTIADRAKSLNLKYEPDDTYQSPEVWANAYRLALYEVPAGVDAVKEHQWLSDQMKQWRDFQKSLDDRKEQLREKAAQLKLAPAPKIADLNTKIDDLQQRADGTAAEEVPLKAELQQAQADLAQAQAADASLDDKYYKQLYSLPGESITKHIPLAPNGRFSWVEDDVFAEGEKEHHYWIFARATRPDGRQYWALHHFGIGKNQTLEMIIEPSGFISTKAILRPNLSPEEQEQ